MPDVFTSEKRSEVMSRIKSRGNARTELALICFFRRNGFHGWRRHQKLVGTPDFVFARARVAVFVDGCFWHGCKKHFNRPMNNRDFWDQKIAANRERDLRVNRELKVRGWRVVRIWEHELAEANLGRLRAKVRRMLGTNAT